MRSDQQIIRDYTTGSDAAFRVLYERHGRSLYAFSHHLCANAQDAEDLCQSTWVEVIKSLAGYRSRSSFRAWLHGIALNLFNSQRRKHRLATDPLDPDLLVDTRHDAQQTAERLDTERNVRAALATLDPAQREIVILHELQGFKYREIAAILQCPIGTVKSRLHYALAALRAALSETPVQTEVTHDVHECPAES